MTQYIVKVYLLLFIICISAFAQESYSNAGTASVPILRFGAGTRAIGLGEAFTGLVDDENALFYNPAGLTNIEHSIITFNHTEWFEDIRFENLVFGYKVNRKIGLGAGITHMWMPGIESFNASGQPGPTINVSSSLISLGMSYQINHAISAGIGARYFNDKLADYSASGVSFDVGFFVRTALPGLSVGLSAQNLGGKIKYDVQDQKIPFTYRAGLAYNLKSSDLLLTLDAVKAEDTDIFINLGIEYVILKQFSLRIGNKSSNQDLFLPSFGAGFNFKQKYHIHYTFTSFADLGATHRIGFSFHFNRPTRARKSVLAYDSIHSVKLVPPKEILIKIDKEQLIISWTRVPGVQYNVYAKHSSQKKWTKLNQIILYNNKMKFKKPKLLGRYYFKVSSVYLGKESSYSKEEHIDVK